MSLPEPDPKPVCPLHPGPDGTQARSDKGVSRARTARETAHALRAANLASRRALVGFDGFVDWIMDLVDLRASMERSDYTPIATIDALARRIAAASGRSANIEVVTREKRWGGNGPLLAGGVARLGLQTTYIGAIGREEDWRTIDPAFAPLAALCEHALPIGCPGRTDALEFADGKLMLNHCSNVQEVTWSRLCEVVGLDRLRLLVSRADLLGIVNWSLLGGVESIWHGLIQEVLPACAKPPRIFIDLSDPAKRTDEDLRSGLRLLTTLGQLAPVTLGLNLAEAERLASILKVPAGPGPLDLRVVTLASQIRRELSLDCVVVHPRQGAGAASATRDASDGARRQDRDDVAWFAGPFTRSPTLSTGAGDHFNAGFAAAQIAGLTLEQCLATGVAVSGAYVRDGKAPTPDRLLAFLEDLPMPEPETP